MHDRKIRLTYVLDTHVHNDYLSGAREAAAATGARIAGPAVAGYAFPTEPLSDGNEVTVGGVLLRALETPGHTPEHTAYLVFDDQQVGPTAVFTGGCLLMGAAGRTDLLGEDSARRLARQQYRSLHRIALLPEPTAVLPTHGSGSFCGAGTASARATSSIGVERLTNPTLQTPDEETFAREQLAALRPYPAYYRQMAPINRAGPRVLGSLPSPAHLQPADVVASVASGATLVDARDRWSFAAGHLPGSLNVELDDTFATYVGWLTPVGTPVVLVLPEGGEAEEEAVRQLLRIGHDHLLGRLTGGVEAWSASGRALESFPTADVRQLLARDGEVAVLDVREQGELGDGAIPGSRHIFVADLPQRMTEIPRDKEVWTVCASGRRAAIAASLLDRADVRVTCVATGGVREWLSQGPVRPMTKRAEA